jgi:arsenite-transporting ATPase
VDVENPPPGTDEIVAMAKVISYLDNGIVLPDGSLMKFDRIVLDTAPTGHTLRMLELPLFMQDLMGKFLSVMEKTSSLDNMFGGPPADDYIGENEFVSGMKPESKQNKIQLFQEKMKRLYELLQDKEESEFTIVTIPTELAVAESKRLLISLDKTGILVRRILINQVLPHDFDVNNTDEKTRKYLENIRNGQSKAIVELENNSKEHSIPLLRVPYFDTEVRTVYGLRAISQSLFPQ